jgi:tetratricopeptide (TPR) repeat protein
MTTLKTYVSTSLHSIAQAIERHKNFIAVILAAGALVIVAFYGYRWYAIRNERQAQMLLAECLHEYDNARAGDTTWEKVEQLCQQAYAKDHSAHTAPYLLALQADALTARGQNEKALAVMQQSVDHFPTSSLLYPLYATKYALMQMDSNDESVHATGLAALETFAKTPGLANHDRAAYYLGLYYFGKNDISKAQTVWKDLVEAHKEFPMQSPWAQYAATKIDLL